VLQRALDLGDLEDRLETRDAPRAAIHRLSGSLSLHPRDGTSTVGRLVEPGRADRLGSRPGFLAIELAGIATALRADLEAGYAQSFAELLHADVFSDFLEMAGTLQGRGFKDAAAVIAGSVSEEHLRKLALKADIATEKADGSQKRAESLNTDLAAAQTYNKLQQKSVTAWIDLRNKAAHGEYDDYDHAQALIRDVREFLIRLPA
jgi:hypothetical protein